MGSLSYGRDVVSKYGVPCKQTHTGSMYGHKVDGKFRTCIPFLLPEPCWNCIYCEEETGDYGELLAGPVCNVNLRFPTKKGSCRRREESWPESPETTERLIGRPTKPAL